MAKKPLSTINNKTDNSWKVTTGAPTVGQYSNRRTPPTRTAASAPPWTGGRPQSHEEALKSPALRCLSCALYAAHQEFPQFLQQQYAGGNERGPQPVASGQCDRVENALRRRPVDRYDLQQHNPGNGHPELIVSPEVSIEGAAMLGASIEDVEKLK